MKSSQKVAFLFATLACCFAFSSSVIAQDNVSSKETDFASELMSKGKYEEARKTFLDISEKSSDKKTVDSSKIFSTLCLFYMNDKEKFINESKEILKNNSSSEYLYALKETLANAFLEKGNFDEAGVYFLAASEDPQASFDQQVNSKISVLNCLFLGEKKDEFLKNSQTFLDESKNYDLEISDNTRTGLNNLKMTTADVFHNNGDWQKAREVYLTVSDANFPQYINARARATQSLYYEGDYLKFEEEFGKIEKMKGDFQSFETESLLLSAASYTEVLKMHDVAAERLQKYLDTSKFSPDRDRLVAKGALGKNLYLSIQSGPYTIKDEAQTKEFNDKQEKALKLLNEFIKEATDLLNTPDLDQTSRGPLASTLCEIAYIIQDFKLVEESAQTWSGKFERGSYEWLQQMFWLGLSKVCLDKKDEAKQIFHTILIVNPQDPYVCDHLPTLSAYWLMTISSEQGDMEMATWSQEWIKKNGVGLLKEQVLEEVNK